MGDTPDSIIPADLKHIQQVLESQNPDIVLTFGKQARIVCDLWKGPALILPHPAYRVVTNDLFQLASQLINTGVHQQIELCQKKDGIVQSTFYK